MENLLNHFYNQVVKVMSNPQVREVVPTLAHLHASFDTMEHAGAIYIGQVLGNKPHGLGFLVRSSQILFGGLFVKGVKTGFGIAFALNSPHYEGDFLGGVYHGHGTLYHATSPIKIMYQGQFINGKFYGEGWYYEPIFGRLLFKGEFQNNKYHKGTMYSYTSPYHGKIFKGVFKNNIITEGKMYDPHGNVIYKGPFNRSAQAHGCGKEYTASGMTYKGLFCNGKYHGAFKVKSSNGCVERVKFVHGQQCHDI